MGYEVVVAPDMRSRRRPKQTVHPANNRRMKETNVIQKPGAVIVLAPTCSLFISCLTKARRAISMANAIRVNSAARKDISDAMSVTVMWVDRENNSARNVAPVATG